MKASLIFSLFFLKEKHSSDHWSWTLEKRNPRRPKIKLKLETIFFVVLSFSLFIFKSFQKLWLWFCCQDDNFDFVRWIFRCCFHFFNSRSWGSCPKIRYTLPCRPRWHPDSWLGCRGQQVHLQRTSTLVNFQSIF